MSIFSFFGFTDRNEIARSHGDFWASQVTLVVKNPTAGAEDVRDMVSILELGRSPGGGHGNPL